MERIDEDTKFNDFSVTLTAEELSFVKLTVFLSGMENGKSDSEQLRRNRIESLLR